MSEFLREGAPEVKGARRGLVPTSGANMARADMGACGYGFAVSRRISPEVCS
jgi:hypothetical protein